MGAGENLIRIIITSFILAFWYEFGTNITQMILGRQPQFYEVFFIYALLLLVGFGFSKFIIRLVRDEET